MLKKKKKKKEAVIRNLSRYLSACVLCVFVVCFARLGQKTVALRKKEFIVPKFMISALHAFVCIRTLAGLVSNPFLFAMLRAKRLN